MAFPPSSAQHRGLDDGKKQILCLLEVVFLVKEGILLDRLSPVLALEIHNVCFPSENTRA